MLSILLPLIDLGITIRYAVCRVQDHAKLGHGEAVTSSLCGAGRAVSSVTPARGCWSPMTTDSPR